MKTVTGVVTRVTKLWWLKVNTKALRSNAFDGARFPHVVTVEYTVNGKLYACRKLVGVFMQCPQVGESVLVSYHPDRPTRCELELACREEVKDEQPAENRGDEQE